MSKLSFFFSFLMVHSMLMLLDWVWKVYFRWSACDHNGSLDRALMIIIRCGRINAILSNSHGHVSETGPDGEPIRDISMTS